MVFIYACKGVEMIRVKTKADKIKLAISCCKKEYSPCRLNAIIYSRVQCKDCIYAPFMSCCSATVTVGRLK